MVIASGSEAISYYGQIASLSLAMTYSEKKLKRLVLLNRAFLLNKPIR